MEKIYFDNAASTKPRKEVIDFLTKSYNEVYANPSATHSYGRESRSLLENARLKAASLLMVKAKDIIFTSGATEANNLAIRGMLLKTDKKEIITSKIEHSSILRLMEALEEEGYVIKYVNVNKTGEIDVNHLKSLISEDTAIVTIMAVNNETGVKQPIEEVSKILEGKNIYFHVDAVQLIGKEKIDPYKLNIDSMSSSAHKFYGPKGVGILYLRDEIGIRKLMFGGSQERNKRPGTENLNSILASVYALELAYEHLEEDKKHLKMLNQYLIEKLNGRFKINGENRVDHIINIQVKGKSLNLLLPLLDMKNIMLSGGSACMSGSVKGSKVLLNMGLTEEESESSIRISFGIHNKKSEIDYLVDCLEKI